MNVVRLMGGLGNQMFQYAFGRRMAVEFGMPVQFDAANGFRHDPYGRRFALGAFRATVVQAGERDIPLGMTWTSPWHRVAKAGWECMPKAVRRVVYEKRPFQYDKDVCLSRRDSAYYVGYWQHEGWFSPISDLLRHEFVLRDSCREDVLRAMKEMEHCNSISIHLRSYQDVGTNGKIIQQTSKYHEACSMEYYARAVERIGCSSGTVGFVFSDHPRWAKERLKLPIPCHHISEMCSCSDVEEMMMMASCKHHVISNSTFSWWGAWLGRNAGKVVVAPKIWMRGVLERDVDICPSDWVRLDA